jgi:hypothetical protein
MKNLVSTKAVNNFATFGSVVIFQLESLDIKFVQRDYVGTCHISSERDASSSCYPSVCLQLQGNRQITGQQITITFISQQIPEMVHPYASVKCSHSHIKVLFWKQSKHKSQNV